MFDEICADFTDFAARLQIPDLHFIPISALTATTSSRRARKMPWFDGSSLLHYLETVHIASDRNLTEIAFPGAVCRPAGSGFSRLCRDRWLRACSNRAIRSWCCLRDGPAA